MKAHLDRGSMERALLPAAKWGIGTSVVTAAVDHCQKPLWIAFAGALMFVVRGGSAVIRMRDERKELARMKRS